MRAMELVRELFLFNQEIGTHEAFWSVCAEHGCSDDG